MKSAGVDKEAINHLVAKLANSAGVNKWRAVPTQSQLFAAVAKYVGMRKVVAAEAAIETAIEFGRRAKKLPKSAVNRVNR